MSNSEAAFYPAINPYVPNHVPIIEPYPDMSAHTHMHTNTKKEHLLIRMHAHSDTVMGKQLAAAEERPTPGVGC